MSDADTIAELQILIHVGIFLRPELYKNAKRNSGAIFRIASNNLTGVDLTGLLKLHVRISRFLQPMRSANLIRKSPRALLIGATDSFGQFDNTRINTASRIRT